MRSRAAPQFRLVDAHFGFRLAKARLPFHFGVMTLAEAWQGALTVTIEDTHGRRAVGVAGDTLAPRWFDKDPARSIPQNMLDLIDSAEIAGRALQADRAPQSLFARWLPAYHATVDTVAATGRPDLVGSYGAALYERAMWSALCRLVEQPFHAALIDNLGGIDLGALHPELAGREPREFLPPAPLAAIHLRHTVGGTDPLTRAEDCTADPRDGRPYTLEENIRQFGLRYFKLKIFGDGEKDFARLAAIAATLDAVCPPPAGPAADYRVTVDGNESYSDFAAVERLLARLQETPALQRFCRNILFIEQPLNRNVSFDPTHRAAIARLNRFKPLVIDEADQNLESFRQAAELGYRGVSAKNCKGVIKSVANRALMVVWTAAGRGSWLQSGEDLTNLPVVPLQQDLTTLAALGIEHAERNGHHFYAGAGHLPDALRAAAAQSCPGLYDLVGGRLYVAIRDGRLNLRDLNRPGYGLTLELEQLCADPHSQQTLAQWRAELKTGNNP